MAVYLGGLTIRSGNGHHWLIEQTRHIRFPDTPLSALSAAYKSITCQGIIIDAKRRSKIRAFLQAVATKAGIRPNTKN